MLNRKRIITISLASLFLFDVGLFVSQHFISWVQILIGLPIVVLLPGLLFIFILGARSINLINLLFGAGLSTLILMVCGLLSNYVPQMFGATHPLNSASVILSFNFLVLSLTYIAFYKKIENVKLPTLSLNRYDWLFIAWSVLTVVLGICGTFRLNNGASNMLSMICLGSVFSLIISATVYAKKLNTFALVAVIFSVGLSLLLLTSLRGWGISGHDIRREYRVFNLVDSRGEWSIDNYRNAYNACISITILPYVFTKLLHTNGLVVFKFIFQLLFLICPLAVFVLLNNYTKKILAFLGAIIFISFPTFMMDSPFLTRQEIAYIFFSLFVVAWFNRTEKWISRNWRALFLLMSSGVILSHYSTTYMYLFILVLVYIINRFYVQFFPPSKSSSAKQAQLSVSMVAVVMLGAFVWYAQITQTSHGLTSVVKDSVASIPQLLQQDNRDSSVNYLGIGINASKQGQFSNYIDQTKANAAYTQNDVLAMLHFKPVSIPSSNFDNSVARTVHISPAAVVNSLYYSIAPKLYELLVAIGLIMILFKRKIRKEFQNLPLELGFLCLAGVVILTLEIVLPNISLDYGLMRAFQQILIFLSVPILVALYIIGERIRTNAGIVIITAYTVFSLMIFSGFLPQLTGGIPAQLSLNNNGPYYAAYYFHESDLESADWLQENAVRGATAHDTMFATIGAYNPHYPFSNLNILPFQVHPRDYVVLSYYQAIHHATYLNVSGKLLPVDVRVGNYPEKAVVYSNGQSQVLK